MLPLSQISIVGKGKQQRKRKAKTFPPKDSSLTQIEETQVSGGVGYRN